MLPPDPAISKARRQVLGTVQLPLKSLPRLTTLVVGEVVDLGMGGTHLAGTVRTVFPDDSGSRAVAGDLLAPVTGSFELRQDLKTGALSGHVLDRSAKLGFEILTTEQALVINQKPLDALVCLMPRHEGTVTGSAARATRAISAVPVLESRPGAAGVLYLDFDGEIVSDPAWNNGVTIVASPALMGSTSITAAQITDVWRRVAEDFRPFDLNVTTDVNKYDAAPSGHRARCIITPTDAWYGGTAGGVAYLKSYRGPAEGWSSTIPCWCWNNSSAAVMAMTISHELGHMMDLSHDGTGSQVYYPGHDSGVIGWGPIMGAPFSKPLVQWSKGEYPGANNPEDDFAIIAGTVAESTSVNGFIPSDGDDTLPTARALAITSPISQTGIVRSAADTDYYSFKSSGGSCAITLTPDAPEPNLDAELALLDSTGAVLVTSAQSTTTLASSVAASLAAPGTYYLRVRGRGRPVTTLITGYTSYGCAGAYTLTGTYAPLPELPLITQQPTAPVTTPLQGTKVSLTGKAISNSSISYQWYRVIGATSTKLSGKTSATLTFTSIQPGDIGDYKLVFSNKAGAVESDVITLDVNFKPIIDASPSPVAITQVTGGSVLYSVAAHGTGTLNYQWKKNGVDMLGETGSSLSLNPLDWFSGASYTVAVSNTFGSTLSKAAVLTITSKPVIVQQPSPLVPQPPDAPFKPVALGGKGSVTLKAVGTAPITYQWFFNSAPISGATKSTLSFSSAKLSLEGSYFCRVTNKSGFTDSDIFTVDVQDPPVIDVHPAAKTTLTAEQPLALDCAAHGTAMLTYQWQLNGVNVPNAPPNVTGADTPNLRIAAASWLHRGSWRCLVRNNVGTATTKTAAVEVISYPLILTHPANTKIAKNGTGTLKVVAGGTPTLKYQWFKDGNPITKATSSSLVLSKATVAATNGSYTVVVTNSQPNPVSGPVTSLPAVVTVEDPPVITPLLPATRYASIGDTVSLSLTGFVSGSPTLRYQWQKNSKDIPATQNASAITDTLVLTNVQSVDTASYRVLVSNDVGKATSSTIKLNVLVRPAITTDPMSQTVYAWDTAYFSVTATGTAPLSYQWNFNGNPITGNTSARTSKLTLTSVQAAAAGDYTVTVSSPVGSVTSAIAHLTVDPVPAPTLIDVRPTNVVVGAKILITGTNLNWTTQVMVNGRSASFVKSRNYELWVTVPSGIASSGALTVTTRGGVVTWPSTITLDNDGAENDDFINAKILSGSPTSAKCNNTNATIEFNEPYTYYRSVWFRWRASFTGTAHFSAYGTPFYHIVIIYSGSSIATDPSTLRYLSYWENSWGYYFSDESFRNMSVTKDTDYFIQLQSELSSHSLLSLAYGKAGLQIERNSSGAPRAVADASFDQADGFTPAAPLDGQQQWQADRSLSIQPTSTLGDGAGQIGGIAGPSVPASASLALNGSADDKTSQPVLHASLDLTLTHPEGTGDELSWGLYTAEGKPLLAALFAPDRSIVVHVDGDRTSTGQIFVPDHSYHLDLIINRTSGDWQVLLDSIAIASGRLVTAVPDLTQLAAGWSPQLGKPAAGMRFDHVHVETDSAEEQPPTGETPHP